MIQACKSFLTTRLQELALPDDAGRPYLADEENGNVFFDELLRDFLKDHEYAACCLPLQDRTKRYGKRIGRSLNTAKTAQTLMVRRFQREILFRCLLYAPSFQLLWGDDAYKGLVEQFQEGIVKFKTIVASDNSAIRIEPQNATRPWDADVELERKLRRPRLAIVRVQFIGGVQTTAVQNMIRDITINPHIAKMEDLFL
jgi:hypothetical protein